MPTTKKRHKQHQDSIEDFVSTEKEMNVKPNTIEMIYFNDIEYQEREIVNLNICKSVLDSDRYSWLIIKEVDDSNLMHNIGDCFGIHPLALDDIQNIDEISKIEDFEKYVLFELKLLNLDSENRIKSKQLSIILGTNYLLTFLNEKSNEIITNVKERLKVGKTQMRKRGVDYLTYIVIDTIFDYYFDIIVSLEVEIERLENKIVTHPKKEVLSVIYRLKRNLISIRKAIWPLRELVTRFSAAETQLIKEQSLIYFRDLNNRIYQIIESIETNREMLTSLMDIYLSSMSHRLNEIMKVLTIVTTIFIPLTFIVGFYGMNITLPGGVGEGSWKWTVLVLGLGMFFVASGMLLFFKKKKWI